MRYRPRCATIIRRAAIGCISRGAPITHSADRHADTLSNALYVADRALYRSKVEGRNRTTLIA